MWHAEHRTPPQNEILEMPLLSFKIIREKIEVLEGSAGF